MNDFAEIQDADEVLLFERATFLGQAGDKHVYTTNKRRHVIASQASVLRLFFLHINAFGAREALFVLYL